MNQGNITILLVEDSSTDAQLITHVLTEELSCAVVVAMTLKNSLRILQHSDFDIILLDLNLPDSRDIDTFKDIYPYVADTPVVILTGNNDQQLARNAISLGAQDFVLKDDIHHPCFVRAINYAIERKSIEKKLQTANSHLQRLNKQKDTFLSILSHDLRTPIVAIAGAIQTLLYAPFSQLTEQQQSVLAIVDTNVKMIERMTNDLLDLNRIEAGILVANLQCIDLRIVFQRVIEQLQLSANSLTITLTQNQPDEPIWIHGDYDRMFHAISNLLINAARFATSKIVISLAITQDDAIATIEDDGRGIPAKHLEHIFERYFCLNNCDNKPASGLGLAIVKAIVTEHKGSIKAENITINKTTICGARFVLTLPLRKQHTKST